MFDRDQNANQDIFNSSLSNDFQVLSEQHRPEASIEYEKNDLRFEVGTGLIFQSLESEDELQNTSFNKDFRNLFLQGSIRQKIGKFGRVSIFYRNSVNVPGVRQLQPVADRTNPTNIVIGNPDLDATVRNNFNLNLSNYNYEKQQGFYLGGNFTFNQNDVEAITTTDQDLIRTTTYTNVDGNQNAFVYGNYNKSWKKDKRTIAAGLNLNGSYDVNNSFTNGVAFKSTNIGLSPGINATYGLRDLFDFDINYRISVNKTDFDIESIQDQDFTNHRVSLDLTTFWPEHVVFGLRGEYNRFGNISADFDNDSFVLIGSLGYKFAKDKAVVKLKAYDILDQVIATRRRVTQDFVSDTSSLALQQYFILSFTYKFSKFGGKDPNSDSSQF